MEEYTGWVMGNMWGYGPKRNFEIQTFKYRKIYRLRWKDSGFISHSYDDNIIQYLGIDANVYNQELKRLGGIKHRSYDYTYFGNKYYARGAAEWINSIIMMKKIAEE